MTSAASFGPCSFVSGGVPASMWMYLTGGTGTQLSLPPSSVHTHLTCCYCFNYWLLHVISRWLWSQAICIFLTPRKMTRRRATGVCIYRSVYLIVALGPTKSPISAPPRLIMLRVVVPTIIDANGLSRENNLSPEAFDAAQRWCGLGSAHGQASTSTTVHSRVVSTQLEFPWQDDEDDEAEAITTIDHCQLGPDDIASFALLDTLTRWLLPHWQGATLHVRTNDVCILRGIRGDYSHSGVWNAVRSLCGQYDVELSAKVVERSSSGILFARGNTRDGKCAAGTVRKALRNPDVVNAAVKWLMESGQQGSTVYRTMLSHLTV
ncbi:hypothetical protein BGY98DRAFT_999408 [Russula aff. rugulosa BPL654]|nr:hypothetical protein BGY98DRAFT_999408 [Russula aff. rugulosa BPL654]